MDPLKSDVNSLLRNFFSPLDEKEVYRLLFPTVKQCGFISKFNIRRPILILFYYLLFCILSMTRFHEKNLHTLFTKIICFAYSKYHNKVRY